MESSLSASCFVFGLAQNVAEPSWICLVLLRAFYTNTAGLKPGFENRLDLMPRGHLPFA